MGWLKKVGQVILAVAGVAPNYAALLKAITPPKVDAHVDQGLDTLLRVRDAVVAVEVAGTAWGQAGPDRLPIAASLTAEALIRSSLVAGREIADPAAFQRGSVELTQAVVTILGSLRAQDE